MNTKLATTQVRLTEWASIIQDCRSSGLKVDEYCQQHDLSRDAYYYWLRKVKEAALQQAGFVELPSPRKEPIPSSDFYTQLVIKTAGIQVGINNKKEQKNNSFSVKRKSHLIPQNTESIFICFLAIALFT